jgi:hypothetical protein
MFGKQEALVGNITVIQVSCQVPEQPVISPVSGHVYERRLIEKYIKENGADPMNGETLAVVVSFTDISF